ncbi:MAG: hypothetical protein A2173_02005 [Planctomycetes bacterium RBG_13_44_8b]|nr:MAG: hypothetical protein A2173_02005 [Planctomycetes bacterium RBG_13_44_8b]
MADSSSSGIAGSLWKYPNRNNISYVQGHWRDSSPYYHRSSHLYRIFAAKPDFIFRFNRYKFFPARPARPVHSTADPDIQLDIKTAKRISRKRSGWNLSAAVLDIGNECDGNNIKTSLSKENVVKYGTADYKS